MIFCRVIDIGHYEITDDVDKEKANGNIFQSKS